jgi:hypothetical protein
LVETIATPFHSSLDRVRQRRKPNAVTAFIIGDMYGRVRIYSAGFAVFTAASVALALTPARGEAGALWLIGWRLVQGVGGAMLMANSTAIMTDAFPARQRGTALGVNQVAAWPAASSDWSWAACCRRGTGGRSSGSAWPSARSVPGGPTETCARRRRPGQASASTGGAT